METTTIKNKLENPKEGDECYAWFRKGKITNIDGHYTISDGISSSSGYVADELFEVNEEVDDISKTFSTVLERIGGLGNNINLPDINMKLKQWWEEACKGELPDYNNKILSFYGSVEREYKNIISITVEGVKIIR